MKKIIFTFLALAATAIGGACYMTYIIANVNKKDRKWMHAKLDEMTERIFTTV